MVKPPSLGPDFYARSSLEVARDLLGLLFWVQLPGLPSVGGRIVETEAYGGDDRASHSSRGPTKRAVVMFGPPGRAYVYLCYGFYQMLNFVTEPDGIAGAVLIRAIEPTLGTEWMQRRRGALRRPEELTNGPGKLCVACGIGPEHNRAPLQGPTLFVQTGPKATDISVSPRVGITQGVDLPWRYFLTGNPYVSRAPQNKVAVRWKPD